MGPPYRGSGRARLVLSYLMQLCRCSIRQKSNALRPGEQPPIVGYVVEPFRTQRVIDRVREVERQVPCDDRQLPDAGRKRSGWFPESFHQSALYPLAEPLGGAQSR
jgi:hypothetical protein